MTGQRSVPLRTSRETARQGAEIPAHGVLTPGRRPVAAKVQSRAVGQQP